MWAARSVPGGPAQASRAANDAATPAEATASRARGDARRIHPDAIAVGNSTRRLTYPLVRPENRVGQRAGGGDVARAVVDEERNRDARDERVAGREPRRTRPEDDQGDDRDGEDDRLLRAGGDRRRG